MLGSGALCVIRSGQISRKSHGFFAAGGPSGAHVDTSAAPVGRIGGQTRRADQAMEKCREPRSPNRRRPHASRRRCYARATDVVPAETAPGWISRWPPSRSRAASDLPRVFWSGRCYLGGW
jgi:hypothetical protein